MNAPQAINAHFAAVQRGYELARMHAAVTGQALADAKALPGSLAELAARDLARCNGMVANLLADSSLAAYCDAGLDCPELTDEEIIEWGAECGLPLAELVARLEAFTVYARAELLV